MFDADVPTYERDYEFLRPLLSPAQFEAGISAARRAGVLPHHEFIAEGLITAPHYLSALAATLPPIQLVAGHRPATTCPIDITARLPSDVAFAWTNAIARGARPLLTDATMDLLLEADAVRQARVDRAANQLRRRTPHLSATQRTAAWQVVLPFVVIGTLAGATSFDVDTILSTMASALTIPVVAVVLFRLLALAAALRPTRTPAPPRAPDDELPVYTVLVPLYRESEVLPDCVDALLALDYPPAKLDIILLLEEDDDATIAAAASLDLPGCIRVVLVPALAPRTKPKALNYGLELARGDYVVIYDAEDVPEPDQLRNALHMFATGGPDLVCVQAHLAIHNARESFLSAQFAIEYAALFDGLLPAIASLGLPLPLGGTSNHFPKRALQAAFGWDAHNVTEDADLGLRLARGGGRIAMLQSTTWEEAPVSLRQWLPQRTRWLKGWFITLLLHTRDPAGLLLDLGLWRTLGLLLVVGGMLMTSVIHLAFYGLLGWYALTGDLLTRSSSLAGQAVVALATFNLAVGYIAATMLGLTSGLRRYGVGLACGALLTPLYWALIAVVALRAGWQVFRRPYDWEKTSHRARRPNWSPPGQAHVRQAHVIAVPADEKPTRSTLEPDHALPTYDGSRPRSRHRSGLLLQQAGAG